jgi:hypothetical protein
MHIAFCPLALVRRAVIDSVAEIEAFRETGMKRLCAPVGRFFLRASISTPTVASFRNPARFCASCGFFHRMGSRHGR